MKTALQIGIETLASIQDPENWKTGSLGYVGENARCLVGHVAFAGDVIRAEDGQTLYPDEIEDETLIPVASVDPTLEFMHALRNTPQISAWLATTDQSVTDDLPDTTICWSYNDCRRDHAECVAAVAHAVAYLAKQAAEPC